MVVYSNNKDWKKIANPSLIKLIDEIKTNKLLVDLSISVVNGMQFVAMGYDDPLMVPPFEQEFDSKPIEQYKKELSLVLKVMEALK